MLSGLLCQIPIQLVVFIACRYSWLCVLMQLVLYFNLLFFLPIKIVIPQVATNTHMK